MHPQFMDWELPSIIRQGQKGAQSEMATTTTHPNLEVPVTEHQQLGKAGGQSPVSRLMAVGTSTIVRFQEVHVRTLGLQAQKGLQTSCMVRQPVFLFHICSSPSHTAPSPPPFPSVPQAPEETPFTRTPTCYQTPRQ